MKRALLSFFSFFLLLSFVNAQQPAVVEVQAAATHASVVHEVPSADKLWAELIAGNERFVAGTPKARTLPALRTSLVKGQHPNVVVLTCSDSRVPPELLFDQSLGDLFVVRSAGNIADSIGVGSIEYAVEHLGSSVLVVLGHTKCGAVTAACSKERMPTPNLQAIVDKIDPAVVQAAQSSHGDALVEAAIQQNVHQSAHDVMASSEVLRHLKDEGKLTVFEAEYNLETGNVTNLNTSTNTH